MGPDSVRITQLLRGPVHIIHTPKQSLCAAFNRHAGRARQVLVKQADRVPNASNSSVRYKYYSLTSHKDCVSMLAADMRSCLLAVDTETAQAVNGSAHILAAMPTINGSSRLLNHSFMMLPPTLLAPPPYAFEKPT